MDYGTAIFGLAMLLTATVVAPVAFAVLAHRNSSATRWVRKRIRWLWAGIACLWLVSLALKLGRGAAFAEIDVIVSAIGFVTAVAVACLERPGSQAHLPKRAA